MTADDEAMAASTSPVEPLDLPIKLPKHWPQLVCQVLVHVVGLARMALYYTACFDYDTRFERVQLSLRVQLLETKLAQRDEQLALYQARFGRLPPKLRPRCLPEERVRVLALMAACGWNLRQAAREMTLAPGTLSHWQQLLRAGGEQRLVSLPVPANKLPEVYAQAAQALKRTVPNMGKLQIQMLLTHAGYAMSVSSVGRKLKEKLGPEPPRPKEPAATKREQPAPGEQNASVVTAKYPNHLWGIDITIVPHLFGFFVPWFPFSVPTRFPFSFHVAVVLDHFSRKVMAWQVFRQEPSSVDICVLLERAAKRAGGAPKHLVSDKGSQFFARDAPTAYQVWCDKRGVKARFGAVGKHGSIAVVERFFLSLKTEAFRGGCLWMGARELEALMASYVVWYDEHRPHSSLAARTPSEVYASAVRARDAPGGACDNVRQLRPGSAPRRDGALVNGSRRATSTSMPPVVIGHVDGLAHLPIVRSRRAA